MRWICKGVRVSLGAQGLFIVEFADGTFYAIVSTVEQMQRTHPPDNSRFDRDYKQFLRTSAYAPNQIGAVSFAKIARNHSRQSKN